MKIKIKPFHFIILLLFLTASECGSEDTRLKLVNQSNEKIVVDYSRDSVFHDGGNQLIGYYLQSNIAPGDTLQRTMKGSKDAWVRYVMRSTNYKLNVFVILYDTLKAHGSFTYIKNNSLYDHSSYSLEELKDKGWIIHYPPKH